MALKISDILQRVNGLLSNAGYVTWTVEQLRSYYEEAVRAIVTALPPAHVQTRDVELAPGMFQELPGDAQAIMAFIGNVTADGAPGAMVKLGRKDALDEELPMLAALTAPLAGFAVHRGYLDPMDPLIFYVSPPVPTGYTGKLRLRLATVLAAPDWNVAGGPDFPLRAGFDGAVIEYVLYRAFGRSDETSPDYQRAMSHKGAFDAELQKLGQLLGVPTLKLQMPEGVK